MKKKKKKDGRAGPLALFIPCYFFIQRPWHTYDWPSDAIGNPNLIWPLSSHSLCHHSPCFPTRTSGSLPWLVLLLAMLFPWHLYASLSPSGHLAQILFSGMPSWTTGTTWLLSYSSRTLLPSKQLLPIILSWQHSFATFLFSKMQSWQRLGTVSVLLMTVKPTSQVNRGCSASTSLISG